MTRMPFIGWREQGIRRNGRVLTTWLWCSFHKIIYWSKYIFKHSFISLKLLMFQQILHTCYYFDSVYPCWLSYVLVELFIISMPILLESALVWVSQIFLRFSIRDDHLGFSLFFYYLNTPNSNFEVNWFIIADSLARRAAG